MVVEVCFNIQRGLLYPPEIENLIFNAKIRISRRIPSAVDHNRLQEDLRGIFAWSTHNIMGLNQRKCEHMIHNA